MICDTHNRLSDMSVPGVSGIPARSPVDGGVRAESNRSSAHITDPDRAVPTSGALAVVVAGAAPNAERSRKKVVSAGAAGAPGPLVVGGTAASAVSGTGIAWLGDAATTGASVDDGNNTSCSNHECKWRGCEGNENRVGSVSLLVGGVGWSRGNEGNMEEGKSQREGH